MYEELVKELRYCNTGGDRCVDCSYADTTGCIGVIREKAADAIEELIGSVECYEATTDMALIEENGSTVIRFMPKWIPVTEALPEEGRHLALCSPTMKGGEPYARILRFSENLESVDRYDFEGINRSGWYYYDDEYGHLEVDTVTHWMPLPSTEGLNET